MKLQTCTDTPQALVERIENFVRTRTGGMIRDLQVEIHDGEVYVSGRTSTYYNKQLATHAAFDLIDDLKLTNDIEVG